MNPQRIQKLIDEIDAIAHEESEKPVSVPGEGVQRAIDCGKLSAVQDILRAIAKVTSD